MSHIGAVCAYFNPCRYRTRRKNFDAFRVSVERAGVDLLTIELVFNENDRSELGCNGNVISLFGGDIMWQKRGCYNSGSTN